MSDVRLYERARSQQQRREEVSSAPSKAGMDDEGDLPSGPRSPVKPCSARENVKSVRAKHFRPEMVVLGEPQLQLVARHRDLGMGSEVASTHLLLHRQSAGGTAFRFCWYLQGPENSTSLAPLATLDDACAVKDFGTCKGQRLDGTKCTMVVIVSECA